MSSSVNKNSTTATGPDVTDTACCTTHLAQNRKRFSLHHSSLTSTTYFGHTSRGSNELPPRLDDIFAPHWTFTNILSQELTALSKSFTDLSWITIFCNLASQTNEHLLLRVRLGTFESSPLEDPTVCVPAVEAAQRFVPRLVPHEFIVASRRKSRKAD